MYDQSENKHNQYKHGFCKRGKMDPDYNVWLGIKDRIFSKNMKSYKNYGGRGITMYEDWINNPVQFIEYIRTLENYRKNDYTIDRINNDGNYEPGNLRWTSRTNQVINQRLKLNNKTGYTGVFFVKKRNNYRAYISVNKKLKNLGTFKSIKDALSCRNNYIIDYQLKEFKIQIFLDV